MIRKTASTATAPGVSGFIANKVAKAVLSAVATWVASLLFSVCSMAGTTLTGESVDYGSVRPNSPVYEKHVKPASEYIQDGLVAMWDGIENAGWGVHDSSAKTWVDISGNGNTLTPIQQSSNPISFISDSYVHLVCDSATRLLRASGSITSAKTIECVFQVDYVQKTCLVCPGYGYNYPFIVFSVSSENMLVPLAYSGKSIDGVPVSVGVPNAITIAFVKDRTSTGYLNGLPCSVPYSSSGNLGWGFDYSDYATVGMASSMNGRTSGFEGSVYCIRIYNRVLSADEVLHNYELDRERFNLP